MPSTDPEHMALKIGILDDKNLNLAIENGWQFREQKSRELAGPLNNLSQMLLARYERKEGDYLQDLRDALIVAKEAVDHILRITSPISLKRAKFLVNLSNLWQAQYQESESESDLDEALLQTNAAFEATPPDAAELRSEVRICLCYCWTAKFQRTGDPKHLDLAIHEAQIAVKDHPGQLKMMRTLANVLRQRYQCISHASDIEEVVKLGSEFIDMVPDKDPTKPHIFVEQSHSKLLLYSQNRIPTDLNEAIDLARRAKDMTTSYHPYRAAFLDGLASCLVRRYGVTKNIHDLNEAIEMTEEMTTETVISRIRQLNLPMVYTKLSKRLMDRYSYMGDEKDLDAGIKSAEQAVSQAGENHPDRWKHLYHAGLCLSTRIFGELSEDRESDMESARCYLDKAFAVTDAPPRNRIDTVKILSKILLDTERRKDLKDLTTPAINIDSLVSLWSLSQKHQQNALKGFSGLATMAAAAGLKYSESLSENHQDKNSAAVALGLLELGRSVVTGSHFENRTDLAELEKEISKLATKFKRYRDKLDPPATTYVGLQEANRNLLHQVDVIQQDKRFATFLLPPGEQEIVSAASSGTIVVINTVLSARVAERFYQNLFDPANGGSIVLSLHHTIRSLENEPASKWAAYIHVGIKEPS